MGTSLAKSEVIGQGANAYISNEVIKGMTIICETDNIKGEDIFISNTQDDVNKVLSKKIAKLLNRETKLVKQTV